ncbi:hypothetical protein [Pseudalkalibacillus hwajinpoensis]|uniref:Sporulation protein n=1 Tax=Guptibacillus hwajinpoensis TaxID=208199 RepID=A0A4U1MI71_9BACL|nr:hypothetical protein [Pseudalkalibacillus hwajinpoensis]TKD70204.1 hypothetical protein FBF83_13250 [Pseudalkalibacillus hwajinpoensis]
MIKSISILFTGMVLLTACQSIYTSEDKSPYAPREYFRAIDVEPIGTAILKEDKSISALNHIKNKMQNEGAIKDVIVLTHNNQAVVVLKPFAYERRQLDEILSEYRKKLDEEKIAAVLLTEPVDYRKAKKMKNMEDVTGEEWQNQWGSYFN